MSRRYDALSAQHMAFIERQHMFFVATATANSRINLSPKGMDTLKILDECRVAWLNLTGSGNETAAHVQHDGRMTLMFCAFEGTPFILRLYGRAKAIHRNDPQWAPLAALFPPLPGARQLFELRIELVQTSCGMGVPCYDYREDRKGLTDWANQQGEEGLRRYWQDKNQFSLDRIPTYVIDLNG